MLLTFQMQTDKNAMTEHKACPSFLKPAYLDFTEQLQQKEKCPIPYLDGHPQPTPSEKEIVPWPFSTHLQGRGIKEENKALLCTYVEKGALGPIWSAFHLCQSTGQRRRNAHQGMGEMNSPVPKSKIMSMTW